MAEELFERQHDILCLLSNAIDNLKKLGSANVTKGTVKVRLDQLDRNWQKFEGQHDDVMKYRNDSKYKTNVYFTEDAYGCAEDAYYKNKAEFLDLLEELTAGTGTAITSGIQNHHELSQGAGSYKSLLRITLPKFSGRYQEWTPFSDLFLSLVGNNDNLPAVEKLHYLKGSLSGEAAKLIASILVTGDNYVRAWEKLQLRYENKRALINAQLDNLFATETIAEKSARDLEHLRSTVIDVIESLRALGGKDQPWHFFLVYLVCHRLGADTHEAWELQLGNSTGPPKYEELNSFLESRVRALKNVNARLPTQRSHSTAASNSTAASRSPSARVHTSNPSRRHQNTTCACCNSTHYISLCPEYRAKTSEQRRELVNGKRLCYNCLGNHVIANCMSAKRCLICGQQHHTTFHPRTSPTASPTSNQGGPSTGSGQPSSPQPTPGRSSDRTTGTYHATASEDLCPQALLATATVNAVTTDGRQLIARALLDQGSELSFVCESIVQALKLPRRAANIPLYGIGAQSNTTTRGMVTLRLKHHSNPAVKVRVEVYILSRLTGRIPAQGIPEEAFAHLSSLELADPSFAIPGPIEILLGANIYAHLLLEDIRKTDNHSLVAQRTSLGWVISGPISVSQPRKLSLAAQGYCCFQDQDLNKMVEQFWTQEQILSKERNQLPEEERRREEHSQLTLSFLRQQVWIIGGRAPVKSFIRKCVRCTRHRGETLQQKMGQLPLNRISPTRPFKNTGVDYAGPFLVKTSKIRNAKTHKTYLVLFVCFTTSAVHLELATDCSTEGSSLLFDGSQAVGVFAPA